LQYCGAFKTKDIRAGFRFFSHHKYQAAAIEMGVSFFIEISSK
jgi:hypothetical protein